MIPFNSPHQIPISFLSHSLAFAFNYSHASNWPQHLFHARPFALSACLLPAWNDSLTVSHFYCTFISLCLTYFMACHNNVCCVSRQCKDTPPTSNHCSQRRHSRSRFLVMTVRQVWRGRTPTSPPFPQLFPPPPSRVVHRFY